MKGLTAKHVIIAAVLAILGILMVIGVLVYPIVTYANSDTIDKLSVEFEGTSYNSGSIYQMDNQALPLSDGTSLTLEYIIYYKDLKQFQLGFTLPSVQDQSVDVPYKIELINTETGAAVCEEPLFIVENRSQGLDDFQKMVYNIMNYHDDSYHYRAIFKNTDIDVEASPDLTLNIKSPDGTVLYNGVFITKKTLFTSVNYDSLNKTQYTLDSASSVSSVSSSAS